MGKLVKMIIAIVALEVLGIHLYVMLPETENTDVADLSSKSQLGPKKLNISTQMVGDRSHNSKLDTLKRISWEQGVVPKWDKTKYLAFIHIGKNGGTSFDSTLAPIVRNLSGRYIGRQHFDWSQLSLYPVSDVVLMLRDPVSRAISHFYFSRTLSWTKDSEIRNESLWEYLHDPRTMLETRDVWQDGQAGVSWLTGTHIGNWVRGGGGKPRDIPDRERQSLNIRRMCLLAAERLEETLWFGFLDDLDRSMELLAYQLGYRKQQIALYQRNKNKRANTPVITDWERETLASLMPQDMWLYSYAKLLFEARWVCYKSGVYIKPQLPPIPTQPECVSTRFAIRCTGGPLAPLYFKGSAPEDHKYII